MGLLEFGATVIILTASGALAPGPLFFATLLQGAKDGGRAGLASAIGHTAFELPLVMLLGAGLMAMIEQLLVRTIVGMTGGLALLTFGFFQLKAFLKWKEKTRADDSILNRRPLLMGFTLTALNPFFLVWWFTVGLKLVLDSFALPFLAMVDVLVMYAMHVWMDYAWLSTVAHFARKGRTMMGKRGLRVIQGAFSVALIYFGYTFLTDALLSLGSS